MLQPVIQFKNIRKTYTTEFRQEPKIALHDLSLDIQKGEVFGLIGPNGAGKSTSLKILLGFVRPDEGSVRINGVDGDRPESHRHIGYLPENPCLYEHLSVHEHLMFSARVAGLPDKEIPSKIHDILAAVDLLDAARIPIKRYSKGMVQRAALAYALILEPEVLILDEPMSGLDPIGRKLVVEIINDYCDRGKTILFSSHILTDVERICSRIGILDRGLLKKLVTPEELAALATVGPWTRSTSPLETLFLETVSVKNS